MDPRTEICYVKSIGPKRAELFNKLGLFTLYDLIHFFPRSYIDMSAPLRVSDTLPGRADAVIATVVSPVRVIRVRPGMEVYKAKVADKTGAFDLVFFNRRFAAQALVQGRSYLFYGKFAGNLISRELVNPIVLPPVGQILPVYPLTEGLPQGAVRTAMKNALEVSESWGGVLPPALEKARGLMGREAAVRELHLPKSMDTLAEARKRLAFEELLVFSAALAGLKSVGREKSSFKFTNIDMTPFYTALGFALTGAQRRVIAECMADYTSGVCQNRLIQGDVGSGKTAVAAALIYYIAKNGCQCALMAPTEVLAQQHYESFSRLFAPLGVKVSLLTGSTGVKARRETLAALESGETGLIIGTHALITPDVKFSRLALVVTDEQHRFGVQQREALFSKGARPHVIVMSATPIPRTLALILYAELDVSQLDELPAGRKKILTYSVGPDMRNRLYGFVRKQIEAGRQAYIVCARAEEDEESELKSVRELCAELQSGALKGLRCGYVYGKMGAKKKEETLAEFYAGSLQALVSTTVVEVGVNVPNATVMVIENAERFGLSQLHQLRGRVGRGGEQSYCILVSGGGGENAEARLDIMTKTNDGFEISRRDLELRGPGEFFGERQSGLARFRIADLMNDMATLIDARDTAAVIIKDDPQLKKPENAPLRRAVGEVIKKYNDGTI